MNTPQRQRSWSALFGAIALFALAGIAPLRAAALDGEEAAADGSTVFAPAAGAASGAAPGPAGTASPAPLAQPPRHLSTDRLIVKFRDRAMRDAAFLSSDLIKNLSARAGMALSHLRAMAGGAHILQLPESRSLTEARTMAEVLQADPSVEYAEPDAFMRRLLVPNDASYASQWHYKEFTSEIGGANLPAAWDLSTGSASTVVAVIDTGLVPHADLDGNLLDGSGRVAPGYDFISLDSSGGCNGQPCTANDGNGRDSDPSDPGDWITAAEDEGTDSTGGFFKDCTDPAPGGQASNSSWHGTHVAGTIGALSNNSTGVAGINWNARILPVRVLGKCGGYLSDIAEGMRWAAGLSITGVPTNANPAKVLNLSLGGDGACGPTYQSAVDAVTAAGATVVVAAGNESSDVSNSRPANCNGVIAVAATTRTGAKASYSNFGSLIKIAAPGGGSGNGVLSTLNSGTTTPTASPAGDTYASYQGTSMATPHIAGIASLMLAVNPALTPAQVLSTLQATARAFPSGTGADCTTTTCGAGIVNAASALQASSPGSNPILTVQKSGTGTGTVASSGMSPAISCGTSCTLQTQQYPSGTAVNLSATAASGSTFAGWSGGCSGSGACAFTMNADTAVTATFNSTTPTFTLSVAKAGSGSGTVTSNPSGINCGSDCTENYVPGTVVTLTASAAGGSTFAGWSGGGCFGTGGCVVTMSSTQSVTATFNSTATGFTLSVAKAGSGSGTVTSSPSGINCGSDCSENYASGTSVTLTASASSGSTFAGWAGDCTGSGVCAVTMTAARNVTATFNSAAPVNLNVTKTGLGLVTSGDSKILCGPLCAASYSSGSSVALTAVPEVGYSFAGWSGPCSGTANPCNLTVSAATTATAQFNTAADSGGPRVTATANGQSGGIVASPVTVQYTVRSCTELLVIVNAPALGINWSFLNSLGAAVAVPANIAAVAPHRTNPPNGTYTLFNGSAPPGAYDLYLACDNVPNGSFDYSASGLNGVFTRLGVTVP